jgi:hypothetical protein
MADNSVLNVEEGAEYTVRNGDPHAERNLNEYGTDTEPYAPAGRINREHIFALKRDKTDPNQSTWSRSMITVAELVSGGFTRHSKVRNQSFYLAIV